MCGQLSPLKFNNTVWVYCSWRMSELPARSSTVSIQNVALTRAVCAFGPAAGLPCRNAVLATPPPRTGTVGLDETSSAMVLFTVCPAKAAMRTEFGLSTISLSNAGNICGGRPKIGWDDKIGLRERDFLCWVPDYKGSDIYVRDGRPPWDPSCRALRDNRCSVWYGRHANNRWYFCGILGLRHRCPNPWLNMKPRFIVPVFDLLKICQAKHVDVCLKETAVRKSRRRFIELQNLIGEVEFQESILSGVLFGRQIMLKPAPVHVLEGPEARQVIGGGKSMKSAAVCQWKGVG